MAYSLDLRERVIGAIDTGWHVNMVVETFKVSRRVVYKWLELRRETGKLEAKVGYQHGHSHKITDWEKFEQIVNKCKQQPVSKMIDEWHNETSIKISESCVYRGLRKLDYTSKKKLSITRKLTKTSAKNLR